ncbi:hypothetical protein NPIL_220271 [Nephila pilipes]|uniref:Secreted protein n=1 Tax=Nephila pilipes TaxID=299642 RepID=A0A8X6PX80_NEPPI|nr:hypothetical protein NPIL_220271 [Nephila pilipes]
MKNFNGNWTSLFLQASGCGAAWAEASLSRASRPSHHWEDLRSRAPWVNVRPLPEGLLVDLRTNHYSLVPAMVWSLIPSVSFFPQEAYTRDRHPYKKLL